LKYARNVLVVEDVPRWQDIFRRAATAAKASQIVVCSSLVEASNAVKNMAFAVAIVDINLAQSDDKNIEGLEVMRQIRRRGDPTSIIMISGRELRDMVQITRDAIREFDAFDTIHKAMIEPVQIRELTEAGIERYTGRWNSERPSVSQFLRGGQPSPIWDGQMLSFVAIRGDVTAFYNFLDSLFAKFLPAVGRVRRATLAPDPDLGIAIGDYWSRSLGKGVIVYLGNAEAVTKAEPFVAQRGYKDLKCGDELVRLSRSGVSGAVFEAVGAERDRYAD
jgi:CheY-like chemotaxis protein